MFSKSNKTGSHQCTRAVCSTFAEIHSTVTPRCIDAAQSPKGNPDSSPPVQSPVMFTQVTVLYYTTTPETPGLSITFGTLSAIRSFETKDY